MKQQKVKFTLFIKTPSLKVNEYKVKCECFLSNFMKFKM